MIKEQKKKTEIETEELCEIQEDTINQSMGFDDFARNSLKLPGVSSSVSKGFRQRKQNSSIMAEVENKYENRSGSKLQSTIPEIAAAPKKIKASKSIAESVKNLDKSSQFIKQQ